MSLHDHVSHHVVIGHRDPNKNGLEHRLHVILYCRSCMEVLSDETLVAPCPDERCGRLYVHGDKL